MLKNEDKEFSWTMLFLVTGFSLFLFAAVLALLNDRFAEYFVYGGAVSVIAGLVAWVISLRTSPVQSGSGNRQVQGKHAHRR
jgi:hypothetical protein